MTSVAALRLAAEMSLRRVGTPAGMRHGGMVTANLNSASAASGHRPYSYSLVNRCSHRHAVLSFASQSHRTKERQGADRYRVAALLAAHFFSAAAESTSSVQTPKKKVLLPCRRTYARHATSRTGSSASSLAATTAPANAQAKMDSFLVKPAGAAAGCIVPPASLLPRAARSIPNNSSRSVHCRDDYPSKRT